MASCLQCGLHEGGPCCRSGDLPVRGRYLPGIVSINNTEYTVELFLVSYRVLFYQIEHRQILDFICSIPFLTEDIFENTDVSSKNTHVLGKLKQLSNIHLTCI